MIKNGAVKGQGTDDVGEFDINGYYKGSKIEFNKKYRGGHTVLYKGELHNKNLVNGRWSIGDDINGEFELQLV